MLYILEHIPTKGSNWCPYENGCIISTTPWSGLIKRLNDTGGWGTRWREIPDNEALRYLVQRVEGRKTEPGSMLPALADLLGEDALWAAFEKTFRSTESGESMEPTLEEAIKQSEVRDENGLLKGWQIGFLGIAFDQARDAQAEAEFVVDCEDDNHMIHIVRLRPATPEDTGARFRFDSLPVSLLQHMEDEAQKKQES